jgi:hypothetical protein
VALHVGRLLLLLLLVLLRRRLAGRRPVRGVVVARHC